MHLHSPPVLSIFFSPAVLSTKLNTAVVIIEDSNGNQISVEDAFHQHRNCLVENQGKLDRLSKCFEEGSRSTVIEDLSITGIQIVHVGSEECPATPEDVCDFVKSIKLHSNHRIALCAEVSRPSSRPLSQPRRGSSLGAGVSRKRLDSNRSEYPPNDPVFLKQKTFLDSLRIQEVWNEVRESGLSREDVVVAIIDTGVAPDHPDLEGKLLEGYDASGAREKSLADNHGHGTLMAGILASTINNRIGIAGIADKVKIHPIRVTESQTGWAPVSQISRAWERALLFKDTNIVVFAHGDEFTELNEFVYMRLLEKSAEQGVFVVTAASNSEGADGSEETPLPWSLADDIPGVVSVAATYATNPTLLLANHPKLASFGAPGTDAWSPRPKRVEGEWLYWDRWGSSVAAAATSGVVALMMSFKNFKPLEIERMLLNSTEDRVRTKWGHEMPYGVLRPDLAVKQAIAETRQSQPDESSTARGKERKANS